MQSKILVHLVIVGRNPSNGDYSIALVKNNDKYRSIQTSKLNDEPDATACTFAVKYINAPLDWFEIRKQTFIYSKDKIHLIYTVTLPDNIKLKNEAEWHAIASLASLDIEDEIEKDIIIAGIKI